jgi:hypothetical protein
MKFSLAIFASVAILLSSVAATSTNSFDKLGPQLFGSVLPASDIPLQFGDHVELSNDGSRMLVGAPNDGKGGSVYLYEHDSENNDNDGDDFTWRLIWELQGYSNEKLLGDRLSMSGDGQIIAVRRYNAPLRRNAEVFNIDLESKRSKRVGKPVLACSNSSGKSVKLIDASPSSSANDLWLLVGCESSDRTEVLRFDQSKNVWESVASLEGTTPGSQFGWSAGFLPSPDDSLLRVAISSPDFDSKRGLVQAFEINKSDGTWYQIGNDLLGEAQGDQFGFSLATSSDKATLAVGAPQCENTLGCVSVYDWNERAVDWDLVESTNIRGDKKKDKFGRSVAISKNGNRVAAASIHHDGLSGLVRVFDLDDTSSSTSLTEVGKMAGGVRLSQFGSSLAMNEDGTMLVVGSSGSKNTAGQVVGSVQAFLGDSLAQPSTSSSASLDEAPTAGPTEEPLNDSPSLRGGKNEDEGKDKTTTWVLVGASCLGGLGLVGFFAAKKVGLCDMGGDDTNDMDPEDEPAPHTVTTTHVAERNLDYDAYYG